jgi:hypothetical protein
MAFQNSRNRVQQSEKWLERLIREEIATSGANKVVAMETVAWRCGVSAAFVEHILRGRAKTVDPDKFEKVREGFCAALMEKVKRIQHEVLIARQMGAGPDRFIEIETTLRRLLNEVCA